MLLEQFRLFLRNKTLSNSYLGQCGIFIYFDKKENKKELYQKNFDIAPSHIHYSYSGFFSNTQASTFAASINALLSKVIFG